MNVLDTKRFYEVGEDTLHRVSVCVKARQRTTGGERTASDSIVFQPPDMLSEVRDVGGIIIDENGSRCGLQINFDYENVYFQEAVTGGETIEALAKSTSAKTGACSRQGVEACDEREPSQHPFINLSSSFWSEASSTSVSGHPQHHLVSIYSCNQATRLSPPAIMSYADVAAKGPKQTDEEVTLSP